MAKRKLYFSPEYFESSLWEGGPLEYADLPLSQELVKKLKKFDDDCMNILDWSDPGKGDIRSPGEAEEYYLTGLRLLAMVRAELGEEYEVEDGLAWIKPKSMRGEPAPDTEQNPEK